jgi:cytochrome P450 family 6
MIGITDLNLVKNILIDDFETFSDRGVLINKQNEPLTAHLVTLESEEWRSLRQKLNPFFCNHKMRMIFRTLLNVSNHTILKLLSRENRQKVEVKELFTKYTIDVIGNVVYGIDMNALNNPNSKFYEMGEKIHAIESYSLWKLLFILSFKRLSGKLRLRIYPSEPTKFFLGIVEATVKYRLENKIERSDILDILLEIKSGEGNEKLSVQEIAAHCFSFFIFGFETTSLTGAYVLYNLAMNQEVQERLRHEVGFVIMKRDESRLTYEAIQEMSYLQMVIDETLRLYPPMFQMFRKSTSDYRIKNSELVIPKGSFVFVPIYSIHRDPEHYPDPLKFDPERFSEENKKNRHPMAYLPFSELKFEIFLVIFVIYKKYFLLFCSRVTIM